MNKITLEEYKKMLVDYYNSNYDNTQEQRKKRMKVLERIYSDSELVKIIDETYKFAQKIIHLSEKDYKGYLLLPQNDPVKSYDINLNLVGGWSSDEIYEDYENTYSTKLLTKIFGNNFFIEPQREEPIEKNDLFEGMDIGFIDYSYSTYISCDKESIDRARYKVFCENDKKEELARSKAFCEEVKKIAEEYNISFFVLASSYSECMNKSNDEGISIVNETYQKYISDKKCLNILIERYGKIAFPALLKDRVIYYSNTCHGDILPMEAKGVLRLARQGFITEKGYFVDRELGLQIARYYDQIEKKYPPYDILLSEDLKKDDVDIEKLEGFTYVYKKRQ